MKQQYYITEFWAGPDGHRQLWHSEITETDPTRAIRNAPPEPGSSSPTPPLLIITFAIRHWTKPEHQDKQKP